MTRSPDWMGTVVTQGSVRGASLLIEKSPSIPSGYRTKETSLPKEMRSAEPDRGIVILMISALV